MNRIGTDRCFIALVCFEKGDLSQKILSREFHGACGWLAAFIDKEEQVLSTISNSLRNDGLRLVSIDSITEIFGLEDVSDEHLVANLRTVDEMKPVVWGTIHCYFAEGTT